MIRDQLKEKRSVSLLGFRYRGLESSRLEALTDTVFGFSITLLVISVSVPTSYLALQVSMYGFLGFIFCSMILLAIWNGHYRYFTYYGLEDNVNRLLNFIFLFILLFYVYPLKYLFNFLGTMAWLIILRALGFSSQASQLTAQELQDASLTTDQWADLMIRFGIGFFLIYLIFWLWYWRAYQQRDKLLLNEREVLITRFYLKRYAFISAIPLISILIVLVFGGRAAGWAGIAYLANIFLIWIDRRFKARIHKSNTEGS